MPSPLSSQTNSRGSLSPTWSHQPAVLNAAVAAAWLTEASPKEHTTTASAGQPCPLAGGVIRRPRPGADGRPTARGRGGGVVAVGGGACRAGWAESLGPPPGRGALGGGATARG